jgi:hypothetical protein
MRREPASFSMRSHFLQKGAERMSDTVDPIGIVGTGRVAQTLGRLLSENGRPVAARIEGSDFPAKNTHDRHRSGTAFVTVRPNEAALSEQATSSAP